MCTVLVFPSSGQLGAVVAFSVGPAIAQPSAAATVSIGVKSLIPKAHGYAFTAFHNGEYARVTVSGAVTGGTSGTVAISRAGPASGPVSSAVMLVWINGPFGGGKTAAGFELHRRLPGSVVCDPEFVGYGLHRMLPPGERSDFQDLPPWRIRVHQMLDLTLRRHEGTVIVPMTLVADGYYAEILGRRAPPDRPDERARGRRGHRRFGRAGHSRPQRAGPVPPGAGRHLAAPRPELAAERLARQAIAEVGIEFA